MKGFMASQFLGIGMSRPMFNALSSIARLALIVGVTIGFLLQSKYVCGEDAVEPLPSLQQRMIAAAERAKPSVVRIVWRHDDWEDSASGVILTADGYVVTFVYRSFGAQQSRYSIRIPSGQPVSVLLSDGRTVPGVAIGPYSSSKDLNFDLVKITERGTWPCAEIGLAEDVKPGETCLALGYPGGPDRHHEQEPSVRIGHMIPWGAPGMLRSSCVIDCLGDRGGGLFDLRGRLIGIHLCQPFSDYHTWAEPTTGHLDIKVVQQNWKNLACKSRPMETSATKESTAKVEASQDAALPPAPLPDVPELVGVAAEARKVTVALVTFFNEAPLGCSGTIVTPDGYIATCAHHQLTRGTDTTVYFADGRTVPAKILGRDDHLDIGLAKITAAGPWPYVSMGKTTDMKAGDPCIVAGYPNHLRKREEVPLVVRGARVADIQYVPAELLSSCEIWDGDSGGGLFDVKGRLVGVLSGPATPREVCAHSGIDGFAAIWDLLVNGPALGDPVPFEASLVAAAVCKAIEGKPSVVCEVLGNGKRRALGTIITPDGYVLTKASELYGDISCRLSDGRVLPAVVHNTACEHDLALLKIEATGLPKITWSPHREMPVGTLVASLRIGQPPTVGVVSQRVHSVAPATGYLGIGKVKDSDGGVEVEQLRSWWEPRLVEEMRRGRGLADFDSPIHVKDVILAIDGRPVPNVRAFEELTAPMSYDRGREVRFVVAGDPIAVTVRRDRKELNLRFPLLSENWNVRDKTSSRSCSFPAVFDTDASLTKDDCGGPLVDCEGNVVGITIALPVSVVSESVVMTRTFVVPASVARDVANALR